MLKNMSDEGRRSVHIEHKVEHFQQRYYWDCGVSCIIMLLSNKQREDFLARFNEICEDEGFGESTWTIDLCYLLKRFHIKHCMYTILLGVNEDYRRHGYYDRIMHLDTQRVYSRFRDALDSGVQAVERSVSMKELVSHLTDRGPAIVLVDAGLLSCDLCKHNKLKAEFRRCFGSNYYRGHYVLLVGHTARRLLYRDPALSPRLCATAPRRLQQARLTSGTDHDIIFIYNSYR
ncbi:protein GUCD1 isoform X2 [Bombyx mandarina]|uniref:Protein GUCD1 isoform X2 n=1 Tax=Bombyx mandarina TaxID=7092 RepID=A0A6J2JYS6_BOMMA|nr:protein GUCD1 isoform X2 [Bombyx mandarina]